MVVTVGDEHQHLALNQSTHGEMTETSCLGLKPSLAKLCLNTGQQWNLRVAPSCAWPEQDCWVAMSAGRFLLDRQHGLYGLQCYEQHDLTALQGQQSGCDHLMSLLSGMQFV